MGAIAILPTIHPIYPHSDTLTASESNDHTLRHTLAPPIIETPQAEAPSCILCLEEHMTKDYTLPTMSHPDPTHDPENVRTEDHPNAPTELTYHEEDYICDPSDDPDEREEREEP